MCTGKCARFVGLSLIPLSLVCIVANTLLLVPNGQTTWTKDHLSLQVWLMAGFVGGGLMVRGLAGAHGPWEGAPLAGVLTRSGRAWREGGRKDGGGLVGTGSPPSLPPNAKHCIGLLLSPRVLS